METEVANTLPSALVSAGSLQHALVRLQLTNGIILTGRIVEVDPVTMNMKLDAITHTAVRHHTKSFNNNNRNGKKNGIVWEIDPAPLRCSSSVVIRGCHIRFMDFIDEEATGGRGLQEIITVARTVRPSLAIETD